MAAIDKIYGTTKQYDEFYNWCEEHKKDAIKYFYPRDGYFHDTNRPITNFTENIDKWMLKNCPIVWVINRIKDQYNIKN